jgi:hypothetical protein
VDLCRFFGRIVWKADLADTLIFMLYLRQVLSHAWIETQLEAAFWKLLHELQTSAIVARKSVKDHSRIEKLKAIDELCNFRH